MATKHIVIIEDDFDQREILAQCLQQAGYRVTSLKWLESLEELIALKPDAFVIDEILPGVSGHIICIMLKSKAETKHLPVVLISADDRLAHIASLCEADGYLLKPFQDNDALQHLLNKALVA